MVEMKTGDIIKGIRGRLGLSRNAFFMLMARNGMQQVTPNSVRVWESGVDIQLSRVKDICRITRTDPMVFFDD